MPALQSPPIIASMLRESSPDEGGGKGLGPVLKGAGHLLSAHVLRVLIQALYYIIVARALGADDLGKIMALLAVFGALVPFVGLGTPFLAIRGAARDPASSAYFWRFGVNAVALMGLPILLLLVWLGPPILRFEFPRVSLLLFAGAEILVYSLVLLLNGILQGRERLDALARVLAGLSVARLTLVAALQFSIGLDLTLFCSAYFVATLLLLSLALAAYGRPWMRWPRPLGLTRVLDGAREGIFFSLVASGRAWLLGLDKMLLPAMVSLSVAGQYAMGFRIVFFAFLPLQSFMAALYPRFFRQGERSLAASMDLWWKAAPLSLAYALPMAVLLYVLAPLSVPLLGPDYGETPAVIQQLCGLLVLMALYVPLGDALAGADHFVYRAVSVLAAFLANLGLNLWLLPRLGWPGAVLAAYVSHVLLLLLYILRVRRAASFRSSASEG